MKLGIFQGAFPPGLDLFSCFRLCKQAGFEGVELHLENTEPILAEARNETTSSTEAIAQSVGLYQPRKGALRLDSSPSEIQLIREMAGEAGLAITSVATIQLFFYPLSSPHPTVRERAIQVVCKMIEAIAQLGGDTVLVAPGMVTQDSPYHDVWQRSQEAISTLVPFAEEHKVTLAIENVWTKFLWSPMEYRNFIDSFNSPFVGSYFDVGNVLRFGLPDQWIEWLGPRLKRIHLKDYRLDIDNMSGFTNLLLGDVPWSRVVQALRKVGYDNWAIAEVVPYRARPEQALWDTAAAMKGLFEPPNDPA